MRAVEVFSKRTRCMVHQVTADEIESWNLSCRLNLPVFSGRYAGFFEESIEKVAVMELFDAPAIHKLFDYGILAGRRTPQFLVIHVGEVLDVTHVDEHGNKRRIERIVLDVLPANTVHVLL